MKEAKEMNNIKNILKPKSWEELPSFEEYKNKVIDFINQFYDDSKSIVDKYEDNLIIYYEKFYPPEFSADIIIEIETKYAQEKELKKWNFESVKENKILIPKMGKELSTLDEYREKVIEFIDEIYNDGETLAFIFDDVIEEGFKLKENPIDIAKQIINMKVSNDELSDSYIGGDNRAKFIANRSTPIRVQENEKDFTSEISSRFNTDIPLSQKYKENTVISILNKEGEREEKIIKNKEEYSNDALITFYDDSELLASEIESMYPEYIRNLEYDEIDELNGWEYDDQDNEQELRELEDELIEIKEEEKQAYIDMEEELAGYEEKNQPGHSILKPKPKHDIWGEILNDIEERKEEVIRKIKELKGETIEESGEEEIGVDPEEFKRGNISTPPISPFENTNESIYNRLVDDIEDEIKKLTDIKSYIQEYDVDYENETEEITTFEEPESELDFEVQKVPEEIPEIVPKENPLEPSEEEIIVDETLKAEEDKEPYESLDEDEETELELMNYDIEDEPEDDYVFHVRIDQDSEKEIIAKIYRDDEVDNWTARVVKGDEEPLQSMEFDSRLDKLEIIGYLADMYNEIEIIDPKEYEYLLDDKEKIDSEYYSASLKEGVESDREFTDLILFILPDSNINFVNGEFEINYEGDYYYLTKKSLTLPDGSKESVPKNLYNYVLRYYIDFTGRELKKEKRQIINKREELLNKLK